MVDAKPTQQQLASAVPSVLAPKSRHTRRHVDQVEDASKLKFGDFVDGEPLSLAEVKDILLSSRQAPGAPPPPDNKVYKSTIEYVQEFAQGSAQTADTMRATLSKPPGFLNEFEIAQIMHLRPQTVDIAIALIPSLERYQHGESSGVNENAEILKAHLDEVRGIAQVADI